jgi:hypothetical protein
MAGNYRTTLVAPGTPNNGAVLNETDQVQVKYELQPTQMGLFGVGAQKEFAGHVGIRVEWRKFTKASSVRTRLDAFPISGPTGQPQVINLRAGGTPDIQTSTNPARPTSLSLQGVNHFDSFEAKGDLSTVTAGLYFRF